MGEHNGAQTPQITQEPNHDGASVPQYKGCTTARSRRLRFLTGAVYEKRYARQSGVRKDIMSSAALKIVALPLGAAASVVAMRWLTQQYGTSGLALYGTVLSIPLLIPFVDLGFGGAATEIVANRNQCNPVQVRDSLKRINIRLCYVGACVTAVAWALYFTGVWDYVVNVDLPATSIAASLTVTGMAAGVPLGIGYRILLGFQRNNYVVALQSVAGIASSCVVAALVVLNAGLWIIIPATQFTMVVFAAMALKMANKELKNWWEGAESYDRTELQEPDSKIRYGRLVVANLLIGVAIPLMYQTGRILLSHFSTTQQVAVLVAASQLYLPLNSILQAAGMSLWPHFTRVRQAKSPVPPFRTVGKASGRMGAIAGLFGVGLIVLGPIVAGWSTGGLAVPSRWVMLSFGVMLVAVGLNLPIGMAMMGEGAAPLQSILLLVGAVSTVVGTSLLASRLGAVSSPLTIAAMLTACASLPGAAWIWWRNQRL